MRAEFLDLMKALLMALVAFFASAAFRAASTRIRGRAAMALKESLADKGLGSSR
jgi:hypothetical protein